jgi:hypothetical protein
MVGIYPFSRFAVEPESGYSAGTRNRGKETTMNWAHWTYFTLLLAGLLLYAHDHGKPKKGKDNFWIHAVATGISLLLVWQMGGFESIGQ